MRVLVGLLTLATVACSVAEIDNGHASSNVHVIDSDATVEADRLIFAAAGNGNDELLALQAGDLLVSQRGDGYLRKVVAVTRAGASIVVTTTAAALEEAIVDGEAIQ